MPDETYVLKGVLMDKETGKELLDENGKRVTAGISFVPENEEGTIEMTFELDARRLAGKSVVVFERLYDEEEHLIAKEEDIENADQTVLYRKQEIPKNTIVEKPGHNSKEVRKSPKTGDENRMDLWLVMLCVFGIAVVTEIVIYKRSARKDIKHIEFQKSDLEKKYQEQRQYENLSFNVDDLLILQDKHNIDTFVKPEKFFANIYGWLNKSREEKQRIISTYIDNVVVERKEDKTIVKETHFRTSFLLDLINYNQETKNVLTLTESFEFVVQKMFHTVNGWQFNKCNNIKYWTIIPDLPNEN